MQKKFWYHSNSTLGYAQKLIFFSFLFFVGGGARKAEEAALAVIKIK